MLLDMLGGRLRTYGNCVLALVANRHLVAADHGGGDADVVQARANTSTNEALKGEGGAIAGRNEAEGTSVSS